MLVVKKFGGTSVANKERIFNVAKRCIEDYKKGEKSEWKEKDGKIIMETNRESKQKILYIDAKSGNPEKMEIKDNNKNIAVYILYKEVSVNS